MSNKIVNKFQIILGKKVSLIAAGDGLESCFA